MHFEAESLESNYEVNVNENKSHYLVSIKENEKDWVHYEISKSDYQYTNDTISFIFNNSSYLVDTLGRGTEYTVFTRGTHRTVKIYNDEAILHESLKTSGGLGSGGSLISGMPGKIVSVMVKEGEEVKEGQPLLVMEAMKMENEMRAAKDTKIKRIYIEPGQNVESGAELIQFDS